MTWESEQTLPKLESGRIWSTKRAARQRANAPGQAPRRWTVKQDKNTQRPHAYGEPTDRRFEMAMDSLTDAIAYTRSSRGHQQLDALAATWPELLAAEEDKELAEAVRHDLVALMVPMAEGLPRCEPIFMEDEPQQLLASAWQSLPDFELREADLLVPNGYVQLALPLPGFWGDEPLVAFGWLTDSASGLAVAIAFADINGVSVPFPTPLAFPGEGKMADYEFPIAKLLVAFWLLASQRLIVTSAQKPNRAVRRRAQEREIESVIVVSLRRRSYPETDGSRNVEWSHRWLTRGHWRNQWYPSENRHKPIWIADFVKGPPDKPFVAKQRAFEFKR